MPTSSRQLRAAGASFGGLVAVLATLMVLLQIVPVVGLVWRAVSLPGGMALLEMPALADALLLSLGTTAVSVLCILLLGTPLALALARNHFPLKRVVSVFVELPIVMPPVVAGLALLTAFGRRGLLGQHVAGLGISVPFTPLAVVLAQVFVAAPFYVRVVQSRFASLPRELEEAARIDGAGAWGVFRHVTLPLSLPALLSGLLLSWARALGEFGATILFAGNLQGKTQTMPLLVYSALERDLGATFASALILLGMAAAALGLTRWLARLDVREEEALAQR